MIFEKILILCNVIHAAVLSSIHMTKIKQINFDFGMNVGGAGKEIDWNNKPTLPMIFASDSMLDGDAAARSILEKFFQNPTHERKGETKAQSHKVVDKEATAVFDTPTKHSAFNFPRRIIPNAAAPILEIDNNHVRYDCPPKQNICDKMPNSCPPHQKCAMNIDCTWIICLSGNHLQSQQRPMSPHYDKESQIRYDCPFEKNVCLTSTNMCSNNQTCAMNEDCTSYVCVESRNFPDILPKVGRIKVGNSKDLNSVIKRSSDSNNLTPSSMSKSKRSTDGSSQIKISKKFRDDCRPNFCVQFPYCPPHHDCAMNLACSEKVCVPLKNQPGTSQPPDTTEAFTRTETVSQDHVVTTHSTIQTNDSVTENTNSTSKYRSDCHEYKDLCLKYSSKCSSGQECKMDLNCFRMVCVDIETGPLSPEIDLKYCPQNNMYPCLNGKCNEDRFSCDCNGGWIGKKCDKPCTLPCVHGNCFPRTLVGMRPEHITEEDMECNCHLGWQGKLCDELKPDLAAEADEAKLRTVKISVSLGCTLLLVIIICCIILFLLWRKRVIVVMRLVYFFKLPEDNDGRLYDAYISMGTSTKGLNFVKDELCPVLEQFGFKLYVQARDQLLGEALDEAIITAMSQSRRTILIVTPEYVQNDWSRFECQCAQIETLKLHQRIVPIILEDISAERQGMSKSLRHILDSVKCLTYPTPKSKPNVSLKQAEDIQKREQHKFWKRLKLTMPKKKTTTNSTSEPGTPETPLTPGTDISDLFSAKSSKSDISDIFHNDENVKAIDITFMDMYTIV